jgi:hypothetical protein
VAAVTFLYLNSDRMGSGPAEELGQRLLVLFLRKLLESEVPVDLVGCSNGAVLLATREGPALNILKSFRERGARIAVCGTCLEHLGLRDSLRVGEPGDMDAMVRVMATADRVISPC